MESSFSKSNAPPAREKNQIIRELGINELLLPKLISDALIANERAKYLLALIQSARLHADDPSQEFSDLHNERQLCGLQDESLDTVIANSTKQKEGLYEVYRVDSVYDNIIANVEQMIDVLRAAGKDYEQREAECSARLRTLTKAVRSGDKVVDEQFLSGLTSADRKNGDSVHLLVADLHKAINSIQMTLYQESIDGAKVYGLKDSDRELVHAFMSGLNQTAGLKFDHPGLETTAARSGDTLLIENNIGVTEAHIIVLDVTGRTVTLTYTDVHLQRIFFLHSLLDKFAVKWLETTAKKGSPLMDSITYHSTVGAFEAENEKLFQEYLEFLGSRIVFLIDWNRARKQLKEFLNNKDAVAVLRWAADNNIGHCGFLKAGGSRLVYGALEQGARGVPLRYGVKLAEILGRERASDFLKFCLKACSQRLIQGGSEFLLRDEVQVELTKYFHSLSEDLLGMVADHATLVIEEARAVRDGLVRVRTQEYDLLTAGAERAKRWESEADALLNKVHLIVNRSRATSAFERIMSNSDDAADSLEEAVFFLTLIPREQLSEEYFDGIVALADCASHCSTEYFRAIENAKSIHAQSMVNNMEEFLQAVDSVVTAEHQADDELRMVQAALFKGSDNFRQMYALSEISEKIEQSTDCMMRAVMILKDYVLGEMMAS